jgi:cytochrome c-type biogenesis protein CcmH/NrfF
MKSALQFRLLGLIFIGVIILLAAGGNATRIDRLGHRMMCACGCNQILLECNHVGCAYSDRMRGELVAAVDNGQSDGDVLQFFIQKYGTTVLAAPTKTGFDRLAWLMPYLALILGIGVVVVAARALKLRLAVQPPSAASTITAAELARFRAQARRETEL